MIEKNIIQRSDNCKTKTADGNEGFFVYKKHIRIPTDGTNGAELYMLSKKNPDKNIPDISSVQPILHALCHHDDVVALILFGSVARGQARTFSDIDLCIITPRLVPESVRLELLSYGSGGIDVSLFWDLPLTIRFRVIKEGKVIFSKDALALHRIKAKTVREYLDIAPLIRRHCLHALGASQ